jgi:AAA domain
VRPRETGSRRSTRAPSHIAALRRWDSSAARAAESLAGHCEVTGNDAETATVRRPRLEKAADEEASGGKERHLTDGLFGRNENRAGDAKTAVAARRAELNQHVVQQAIEAPVSPSYARRVAARDCVEAGELAVVVPEPALVVADQTPVARKTVELAPSLPNGEERPVHRPVQAVMLIVADGRVAVIQAALHVHPLGRSIGEGAGIMSQSSASDYDPLDEVLSWAEDAKEEANSNHNAGHDSRSTGSEWLDGFILRHNITVLRREPWDGGLRLILAECPFNPDHKGGSAALFINANGQPGFKCHHNGWAGKTWRDVRQKFEPRSSSAYEAHADDRAGSRPNGKAPDEASRIDIDKIPTVRSFDSAGIEFVVEGLIARGSVTMISGESGHGKSTLATAIAFAIAKGLEFAGRKCSQRPVLILDRENGIDVLQERFARLGIVDESGLMVWGGWLEEEAPTPGAGVVFEWGLRTDPKPVVVVDSVIAFLEGDENSATAVRSFMSQLRRLANLGATVIVLHHTGKAETSQEYRGSSDLKGAIDVGINVQNHGEGELGKILLTPFKSRFAIGRGMVLEYRGGQFFADETGGRPAARP